MANISNEYFTIQGSDEYRPYLESILEMVSEKASLVRSFFNVSDYRPVKVTLFADLEDLKDEAKKTKKKYEEYAEGSYSNKGIGVYVKQMLNSKNLTSIVNKIVHQYSHIIYASIYADSFERPLWLDEGIAQTLSGERSALQNSKKKSKSAFLRRIVGRRKEIPNIAYLYNEGNGQHTIGSPRYSGYLLSYFMVNYLLSSKVPKIPATEDDYIVLNNDFNAYESPLAVEKMEKKKMPLKNRYNFDLLLRSPEYRKMIEKFLIVRTVNYYGSDLGVKMSAASYKHVKTPQDILDYMNANFAYGWFDEKNELHKNPYDIERRYRVSSFEETLSKSYGTNIEFAKFILTTLKRLGYQATVFVNQSLDSNSKVQFKTFVVYLDEFENACLMGVPFSNSEGIYKFDSFERLIGRYTSCMAPGETLYELLDIPDYLTFDELLDYIATSDKVYEVPANSKKELR